MAISSINSVWPFFAHFGVVSSPTKVPCVIYFCSKLISLHSGTEEKICMESLLYNRPYMTVLFGKRLSLPWPWGRVHWFSKHFWIFISRTLLCTSLRIMVWFFLSYTPSRVLKKCFENDWSQVSAIPPGPVFQPLPLCRSPTAFCMSGKFWGLNRGPASAFLCCFQTMNLWLFLAHVHFIFVYLFC